MRKTPYTNSPRTAGLRQIFVSYSLLAAILFLGLPTPSNSQNSTDNPLAATGLQIVIADAEDATISKMSIGSFSELRSLSSDEQASTGVAMNSNGDPILFTLLHLEFETPAARTAVFSNQKVSRIAGATVVTVSGRFADVFVAHDAAGKR